MSQKVADVIVQVLESAGVKRCYGIVGDTLNRIAESITDSDIEWVTMRHEEAGAFAASAEAQLTGGLVACAGSCGPGSLHFINGLYDGHRNRAPVILIASQLIRKDLGFQSVQEVDFKKIYGECSVYCDMIYSSDQARRKTVAACQAALTKRGVAVLIVPADVSREDAVEELPFSVHVSQPVIRPNDDELDKIAAILNEGGKITIYGGSGCMGAHDEVVATASRLNAPIARTSRAKDALQPDNPYDVGMTGLIGNEAGYKAILECDTLLLLGADSTRRRQGSCRSISTRITSAVAILWRSAWWATSSIRWRRCCRALRSTRAPSFAINSYSATSKASKPLGTMLGPGITAACPVSM